MSAGVAMASGGLRYDARAFARRLTESGQLSEQDVRLAEEVSRQNRQSQLKSVLDLGLMGEDALAESLASFMGLARWDGEEERGELTDALPAAFMRENGVLVLREFVEGDGAESAGAGATVVVVTDPSDRMVLGPMVSRFSDGAQWKIGTLKDVRRFLEDRESEVEGEESDGGRVDVAGEVAQLRDLASEAPVIRFFNQVVERAMDLGASDIHLERFDRRAALRFRVDGMLIDQPAPAAAMYEPLLCRVKILSSLDIAERRRAQDGRIQMRMRGRMVDMRVSIVPTLYGQDAAIRLQDRARLAGIELRDLGFSDAHIGLLRKAAAQSHGILLITGPTGSGKTTTLYSLLREIATGDRKVVTVEDPVEYSMDGVNQIQVNASIGLTFGTTLRHILRHDPDVILVGEVRDKETAEMAFQSALTGHMVLSTLHTNDVPSTFVRLVDMGIEPYLVNAAVEGVSAQRLVRKVCEHCRNMDDARGACKKCGGLGYRGRVAIMEFSRVTTGVKRAMLGGAEEHAIRAALEGEGFETMVREGERLIAEGVTDRAEIARVLGHAGSAGLDDVSG